jgi:hypothetical protein
MTAIIKQIGIVDFGTGCKTWVSINGNGVQTMTYSSFIPID